MFRDVGTRRLETLELWQQTDDVGKYNQLSAPVS